MSMTKRYLESLPKEQQDDMLGLGPQDDEWTESAENEPADEGWPEDRGDEQCLTIFERVEQAPLVKPRGKCVKETAPDGVVWNL